MTAVADAMIAVLAYAVCLWGVAEFLVRSL